MPPSLNKIQRTPRLLLLLRSVIKIGDLVKFMFTRSQADSDSFAKKCDDCGFSSRWSWKITRQRRHRSLRTLLRRDLCTVFEWPLLWDQEISSIFNLRATIWGQTLTCYIQISLLSTRSVQHVAIFAKQQTLQKVARFLWMNDIGDSLSSQSKLDYFSCLIQEDIEKEMAGIYISYVTGTITEALNRSCLKYIYNIRVTYLWILHAASINKIDQPQLLPW